MTATTDVRPTEEGKQKRPNYKFEERCSPRAEIYTERNQEIHCTNPAFPVRTGSVSSGSTPPARLALPAAELTKNTHMANTTLGQFTEDEFNDLYQRREERLELFWPTEDHIKTMVASVKQCSEMTVMNIYGAWVKSLEANVERLERADVPGCHLKDAKVWEEPLCSQLF